MSISAATKRARRNIVSIYWNFLQDIRQPIVSVMIRTVTLPYYRLFHFNTLGPIKRIASHTAHPEGPRILVRLLSHWREQKLAELQFISIACAVIAGTVIGSFSWMTVPDTYWLASALWFCSLVLAILGILLSAQQIGILGVLGVIAEGKDSNSSLHTVRRYLPLILSEVQDSYQEAESRTGNGLGTWKPRWKMVFTWQCPIMFMSYSVCLYLAGLTVLVCTPLIREDGWSDDCNTAVIYLVVAAISGGVFTFCSFWGYHYVDPEQHEKSIEETSAPEQEDERPMRLFASLGYSEGSMGPYPAYNLREAQPERERGKSPEFTSEWNLKRDQPVGVVRSDKDETHT